MVRFPAPSEINTPWEPQPIVWRRPNRKECAAALKARAKLDATHLVREVLVRPPNFRKPDTDLAVDNALETLERTNTHFDILRLCGIEVAPTDWHVFRDQMGRTRTLARVAIIDGDSLPVVHHEELCTKLEAYSSTVAEQGEAGLHDIRTPRQYLYGAPRQSTLEQAGGALYLVDIEPIFSHA